MGESWNEFCDTLKAAGAAMMAPGAPTDPLTQAEGYRYLSRLARAGLENYVECNNVLRPQLCAIANGNRAARICIGSDNPDNLYENATIDSRFAYIVKGYRGTVPYLGLGTQSGRYGAKGGLQTIDYIDANDLIYEDDDSDCSKESIGLRRTSNDDSKGKYFKIILSKDRPVGANNWLRLSSEIPEAMFIVRQTFGKRHLETPASLQISLYGEAKEETQTDIGDILTAQHLDDGLQSASVLVAGASAMFAKWAYDFQSHQNQLPLFDPIRSLKAGGDPNIRYYHSYWRLEKDKVLRIKVRPPPCRCWNFQLNNHWMESLDYRHHSVHTNNSLARPDDHDETSYTILVSHHNPNTRGLFGGNWIQTAGHICGTMCFRYVAPMVQNDSELPHPIVDVVSYSSIIGNF